MEYTERQKASFKEEFAARRKRQLILVVPVAVVLIGFGVLADEPSGVDVLGLPSAVVVTALGLLVVGAVVFSFMNWRCPACNTYLGKGMNPHFCPKCGVALQ
jgi:hypothetical protein